MADKIKTTSSLKIDCDFVDGDTRAFSLKNPKSTVSSSDIADLNQFMQINGVIIGDKYSATFLRIATASRITKTTKTLDIDGE